MRQITADEFKAHVGRDPAWASKLTEPVEVTEYCDMENSNITHLSPLLHFTGRNRLGATASFWKCKSLKVAEGNFHGRVSFTQSGIEKIGNLYITVDNDGNVACFRECKSLKVAEGTFHGFVNFNRSSITTIGKLIITKPASDGSAAFFRGCKSLIVAEGTFPGCVDFTNAGIDQIGSLRITNPDKDGEYLLVEGSPVAEKPHELRKVFQGMPLTELQTARQASRDNHVKLALESVIGRLLLKNSTPISEL